MLAYPYEILQTKASVLADNDALAAQTRQTLNRQGTLLINLMASPGAGKTTTLLRTIRALQDELSIGVLEADADGDTDAAAVAATGVRVLQVHTGGSCHMDADMTRRALDRLGTEGLDLIFLENVGNLVCPAEFDVGAQLRVMILSLPEGDDKPLKYPLMFQVSDCLLVNKTDTAPIFEFDLDALRARVHELNPEMPIYPLSAATGDGFAAWLDWLREQIRTRRTTP